MITVRVTEEEYNRFRELCFSRGIRSFSEMTRAAINTFLQEPHKANQTLESRVAELEGRIHLLVLEIRKLARTHPA
jgi:metal-responsive CopG/Arc/MetJ family transcriptional regulator